MFSRLFESYEETSLEIKLVTDISILVNDFIDSDFIAIDFAVKKWIKEKVKSSVLQSISLVVVTITPDFQYMVECYLKKDENTVIRSATKFKPTSKESLDSELVEMLTIGKEVILKFE